MNRLAIFDCDGTLADGAGNICRAMVDCFADAGLPQPGDAATRRIVGLSLPEAMRVLHPAGAEADHHALAERYKRVFQRLRAGGMTPDPLYPDIAAVLDGLEQAGWLLGVATGKSDRGLALCLDHHGLGRRFVTLQTADRHPSKPHPSMIETAMAEAGATPATTAMIGDTSFDMAMAKAAGARAVGVAWGYHDAHDLVRGGAQAVATRTAALLDILA